MTAAPMIVRPYSAKQVGWFRERNEKILYQSRTMSHEEIADYWLLEPNTVRKIIEAEIRKSYD